LAQPSLLKEITRRLERFEIDGVLDSGVLEQLTEERWLSPFPQFQTTKRADRAAMAVLNGRILLMSDNSPEVLMLPTDYNSFIQTSDDYYNRWEITSFTRALRYLASILAMTFPALYLTALNYQAELIPGNLLITLAKARQGVPFPAVVELLLMELAFELLREAGIRMPGNMGNAIGIVGGLIVGQAAVEANLVSPVVVLVVAFTALCSFAVPNEAFASAFRLIKFFLILLCALLGFGGLWFGILFLVIHLSGLESFGIPYLVPLSGTDAKDGEGKKDFLIRTPIFTQQNRPSYARKEQRVRFQWKRKHKK
jgi:spore germination protein